MTDIEAVLFDFSGTLMHIAPAERWVDAVLADAGLDVPEGERHAWAARVDAAGGLPGGLTPAHVPDGLATAWAERDLDAATHRRAYTGLIEASGWPWPELADALYDRHVLPETWEPYPDAADTLRRLRAAGIRTGLISNIASDPRPALDRVGLLELLDGVVASYEEGVQKPDPEIFRIGCARVGSDPRRTVMVGDSREADSGGEVLGIRTVFVDPLPVTARPAGFTPLLTDLLDNDARV